MFKPTKFFDKTTNKTINVYSTIDENLGYYCSLINRVLLKRPQNKNTDNENLIINNIINYYMNEYYRLYRQSLKDYNNDDNILCDLGTWYKEKQYIYTKNSFQI